MLSFLNSSYGIHKDIDALKQVPITERGNRSDRWAGINHGEFVELMQNAIKDLFGWTAADEQYAVSPSGAILIGAFHINDAADKPIGVTDAALERDNVLYSMGFAHGNDSSKSMQCAAGGTVMVCQNGICAGDHQWPKRKHTTGNVAVDTLVEWFREGLKTFASSLQSLEERMNVLRSTPLDGIGGAKIFDGVLLKLARTKVIPWRLCGLIDEEWIKSRDAVLHPFHERDGWSAYNCCTEVVKRMPVRGQFTAMQNCFTALESAHGIEPLNSIAL